MNIEETKKIIQNKIQADEAAREVRSQIKTYIHEKQNAREGFTETFKPLIETSEKVKESVDTQQNKLIKQLQENQLALTQGFEGNRLAITSGFDKMDEDKKMGFEQIPDLEAIEEPEMEEEEEEEDKEPKLIRKISMKDYIKNIERDIDIYSKLAKHAEEKGNKEIKDNLLEKINKLEEKISKYRKEMEKKPKDEKIFFDDSDINKYLVPTFSQDILKEYGLQLPSTYKYLSLDEFDKVLEKGMNDLTELKKKIKNVSEEKSDYLTKYMLAFPSKKASKPKSIENIKKHNVLQMFFYNMLKLRELIEGRKTGSGIIHFNNPQQLVSRLKLLAGSIIAGNNGVKQEFSQIAHLLHQLKIISKKTLNDLLKKYILLK